MACSIGVMAARKIVMDAAAHALIYASTQMQQGQKAQTAQVLVLKKANGHPGRWGTGVDWCQLSVPVSGHWWRTSMCPYLTVGPTKCHPDTGR